MLKRGKIWRVKLLIPIRVGYQKCFGDTWHQLKLQHCLSTSVHFSHTRLK